MIAVAIVDHPDSGANGVDLVAIAHALEKQVQRDFAPVYGVSCTVGITAQPLPGAWTIGLFEDSDQPAALGYHDLVNGLPLAKVFPKLDAQDGANLSTTISHELLEMLADPWLTLAAQTPNGFAAYEACDPVERDEYDIDGIKVSNFVTPFWYVGGSVILDLLGLCKVEREVRPGGYAQFFDPTQGWQQVTHDIIAPRSYRQIVPGRTARRRLR